MAFHHLPLFRILLPQPDCLSSIFHSSFAVSHSFGTTARRSEIKYGPIVNGLQPPMESTYIKTGSTTCTPYIV